MSIPEPQTGYRQFTKPAELHKAVNTLRGIVAGISCNNGVSPEEIRELVHWCSLHEHLRNRHPFSELLPTIEQSIQDGTIDEDEQKDILWLCNNFIDNSNYYNEITSSIQFLNGMVHGMMADGKLDDKEIHALRLWLDTNDFLQGCYPFDELTTLVHTILEDGKITTDERNSLLAFMSNLVEFKDSYNLVESDFATLRQKYSVSGICAYCPDVEIKDKLFCFTGESYRATRSEIRAEIERLGGKFRPSVSGKTDYLVVGNAGNPCWAYSCYGRKIEEAMALRKEGAKVQIINETDFWNAIQDADTKTSDSQLDITQSSQEDNAAHIETDQADFNAAPSDERKAFELIYPELKNLICNAPLDSGILVFQELGNCSSVYFLDSNELFFRIRLRKKSRYILIPDRYNDLLPVGTEISNTKSNIGMVRIHLDNYEDILKYVSVLRAVLTRICRIHRDFGCCGRYKECSDAKVCVHPDPKVSIGCWYQQNLLDGKIFYGENRTT